MLNRKNLNELFRPIGTWSFVFHLWWMPPAIFTLVVLNRGVSQIPALIGLFTVIGGWFVAAFWGRGSDKKAKLEAAKEIKIAEINDDDEP